MERDKLLDLWDLENLSKREFFTFVCAIEIFVCAHFTSRVRAHMRTA